MKKIGTVILAIACVALLCGGFYLIKNRSDSGSEDNRELTKVEKLITRNIDENYPATPRAVIKLYNQIVLCFYQEKYTDKELDSLIEQQEKLFDTELAQKNPSDELKVSLLQELSDYKKKSRTINQASVCDSYDVLYKTDPETKDEIAYVTASYFIKEKKKYNKTYQMYVLRKDKEERWKILTFYKVEGNKTGDEE